MSKAYTREDLIELLKNKEVRRRYVEEWIEADFDKLLAWMDKTTKRTRVSKKAS